MTRCYKKGFNAFKKVHVNDKEENTYIQGGVNKYKFKETHCGHKFSHLIQLKFPSIPQIALPKGKLPYRPGFKHQLMFPNVTV